MKLGFFTMPIHPLDKDWRTSLREDREAFLLADKLGYTEAYVGEHSTDRAENITSCMVFIASLIHDTKTIKLGTGTINMPNQHPAAVAANIAMLDHMLDGRFNPSASARAACCPTPRRSASLMPTAARCSSKRSMRCWRSGSASRPTTSKANTGTSKSKSSTCRRSARASCRSRCRNRIPRSW